MSDAGGVPVSGRPDLVLRRAETGDAEAIERIYEHYVLTSTATFDLAPPGIEARRSWIADRAEQHPAVVALRDGEVIGWAALGRFRERGGWRHTAEVAVYVAADERGSGTGTALLAELVRLGREAGLHALISQVVGGNEASVRMAERAGFVRVGELREVGRKFDQWLDVVLLELVF